VILRISRKGFGCSQQAETAAPPIGGNAAVFRNRIACSYACSVTNSLYSGRKCAV
jgi:hypothetical protein